MVDLVNQERIKAGLKPLQVDMLLVKAARLKSQDMVAKGYFGHISPTYGSPFDLMKAVGVTFRTAGENLAGTYGGVYAAHQMLMNSEGHRSNILSPSYGRIGIGTATGSIYGTVYTQMFAD